MSVIYFFKAKSDNGHGSVVPFEWAWQAQVVVVVVIIKKHDIHGLLVFCSKIP